MDNTQLFLIAVAAEVINCLVLYFIINSATQSTRRAKYEFAQTELLAEIAKAQGVSTEAIKTIFTRAGF